MPDPDRLNERQKRARARRQGPHRNIGDNVAGGGWVTGRWGPMTDRLESLRSLQERVDARAESRVRSDRWAAHEAVLDRLAANVRVAQIHGWTSCAIERVDGSARFSAWGVPPGQCERHPIPDWTMEPAAGDERHRGE